MATQANTVPLQPQPQGGSSSVGSFVRRNGLIVGLLAISLLILIILIVLAPTTFLSSNIYTALMVSVPLYGVIALPMTLLIIAKEIDLSFVSVMSIGMVGFLAVFNVFHNTLIAIAACLIVGALAGLLNGLLIVRFNIPSLIATIGTQFFFAGLALVLTNGSGGSLGDAQAASPFLNSILVGKLFGVIPAQAIWMLVVAIVMWFLLNRHRFGAHVYLIGDNYSSAKLMGININQRRVLLFVLLGVAAAFAGLLTSMNIGYYYPTAGQAYLLQTLAAVFLGGTPVFGGVGTVFGTFIGCYLIGVIEPATVAVGLTGFWTQLIYGLVIVVSVAMHAVLRRRLAN